MSFIVWVCFRFSILLVILLTFFAFCFIVFIFVFHAQNGLFCSDPLLAIIIMNKKLKQMIKKSEYLCAWISLTSLGLLGWTRGSLSLSWLYCTQTAYDFHMACLLNFLTVMSKLNNELRIAFFNESQKIQNNFSFSFDFV